ncbi:alpha-N-acetylgalactosaminide alpha-2,6-sialyltransferase 2-like isoform X2 [Pseudophryne corroboree]|uniref:alpha-N-acetylgalactosaminide alpha-2,6-sialyltransferase 2-like isoform X2 n=1 Tax=Pseudophryne corroboree TaxID=495146 RepID=UPI0030815AB6
MQIIVKIIPCLRGSFRIYKKLLLLLCVATVLVLLVGNKEKLFNKILPRQSANERYDLEMVVDYNTESIAKDSLTSVKLLTESIKQEPLTTLAPLNVTPTPKVATKLTTLRNVSNKSSQLITSKQHVAVKEQDVTKATTSKAIARNTVNHNSTTFSYLGDKYATDDTYLTSKCPNRIRDILQREEFQEMFVETIPVFQWKKHAEELEYRRLQMYAGSQGWMGVTWRIIKDTLNLLNSTSNAYMFDNWKGHSPCIRCAVVGNAGILNGSGMGKEIDEHDYVFRVNGAVTEGFEEDVGTRTSFFTFSTNTLMNSLGAYRRNGFKSVPRTQETRFIVLPDHDRDYLMVQAALTKSTIDRGVMKGIDPTKFFGKNLTTEHFKILHPDFMRYLRNRSKTKNERMVLEKPIQIQNTNRDPNPKPKAEKGPGHISNINFNKV